MKYDDYKFPYEWYLKDDYPARGIEKNNLKVFSCFSCGGGSTMGYKLAGYDVIGCNEIDPRMMEVYRENHKPKYSFLEPIQEFKNKEKLPKELYNLDILDGSPPCFTGETLVMASTGFKSIKEITTSDFVLTHTNSFQKVETVMNKSVKEVVEVTVQGSLPINTTEEHPFYIRRMNRRNKKNSRNFSKPFWKNVKDLSVIRGISNSILEQDYVGVPLNSNSELPSWDGVSIWGKKTNTLDFTKKSFWYLVGRWFGDGWLRIFENTENPRYLPMGTTTPQKCLNCGDLAKRNKRYTHLFTNYCSEKCRQQYKRKNRKSNRHTFIICCGKHEFKELKEKFEESSFNYGFTEERTVFKFYISSKELCYYMKQFGNGAKNKKLTSDILNLPIEYASVFLNGYLDADGHIDKRGKYVCSSISKELIYGIQALVYKVYKVPTTITIRQNNTQYIENRKVNTNVSYGISFYKESRKQQHGFYENNYMWLPFRKKEVVKKNEIVYNLSVLEDESYTVYNFACHNCSSFSVAGNREKDWGKEKKFREGQAKQVLDTLFFDYIDLAKRLQPKVVIAENVKGLLLGNAREYVKKILKEFDKAGYVIRYWLLNASKMGVPQKRERVFFIGMRKDLAEKHIRYVSMNQRGIPLNLKFNEKPIVFEKVFEKLDDRNSPSDTIKNLWEQRVIFDYDLGCTSERINKKRTFFNWNLIHKHKVCNTIKGRDSNILYNECRYLNNTEIKKISSFPLDYNFLNNKVDCICGMSVPPITMAQISNRIYEQWFVKLGI